jgi:hypothetical protein
VGIEKWSLALAPTYVQPRGGGVRGGRAYVRTTGHMLDEFREAITQCSARLVRGARKRGSASLSGMRVRRRALMWLILAPQLFLRPAIRGGKRGRRKASQQEGAGLVAARLQQWENGEQIGPIQSLRVERLRAARSAQSRAQRDTQSQTQAEGRGTAGDTTKLLELLELIGRGAFNKAATQLASLGVLGYSAPPTPQLWRSSCRDARPRERATGGLSR